MTRFVLALVLSAALLAPAADAQARRGGAAPAYGIPMHKAEIFFVGGFAWTFSVRAQNGLQYGDLDIKDNGWFGAGIDFQVRPGGYLTLLYRRQSATYTFNPDLAPKVDPLDKGAVEYFHIGGTQGMPRGKALPFGSLTLGATRFSADNARDDYWKFSVIPGLGVKYFASPRLGLRLQADLPISFTSGGIGFGCGGGGCGSSFYGTGITQLDVGGGLFLMF